MKIHFVVKPNHGPDWHRLVLPMESLPIQDGDTISMAMYETDESPELFECDILIFNRTIKTPAVQLERLRNKYGFKIVLDLDDYWELGLTHPLYNYWQSSKQGEEILSYIKIADLVTVTTDNLRAKVSKYNPRVEILPNGMTFEPLSDRPRSSKTRFLYAGSVTHIPDLEILRSKFRRIDPYIRDSASFVLAGVGEHKGWEEPKKIFESTGSYQFLQVLPLDRYMEHYDSADVTLVPLQDNEFNRHKSILKVIEAASRGLTCIVSQVQPYYPELKDAPVMWAENGSDWLRQIRFCIKNPKWLKKEGEKLYHYMKERYSLENVNKQRYQVLRGLVHE